MRAAVGLHKCVLQRIIIRASKLETATGVLRAKRSTVGVGEEAAHSGELRRFSCTGGNAVPGLIQRLSCFLVVVQERQQTQIAALGSSKTATDANAMLMRCVPFLGRGGGGGGLVMVLAGQDS